MLAFLPSMILGKICPDGSTVPDNAVCLNLTYPSFNVGGINFDPETKQNLNELVAWGYYFFITIAGFSAFFTIVTAGFSWMTSRGSPAAITEAKDKITSAFLGLVIILSAYLILQILNPDLTTLNLPSLPCTNPPCPLP